MTDAPEPAPRPAGAARTGMLTVLIVALALIGVRLFAGGGASLPPYFDKSVSFEEGTRRARADGRVVFAYVGADWCAPCQTFKRTTLADPRIADWVRDHAVPVYADRTNEATTAKTPLPVSVFNIPTIVLFREGREAARIEGAVPADTLIEQLSAFLAAPGDSP